MFQHQCSRQSRRALLQTSLVVGAAVGAPSPPTGVAGGPGGGNPAVRTELQSLIDDLVATTPDIPGLLVSVNAPGQGVEWSGAAGLADWETGKPLVPDSTFRTASITKTFTAATLRLAEEGDSARWSVRDSHALVEFRCSLRWTP